MMRSYFLIVLITLLSCTSLPVVAMPGSAQEAATVVNEERELGIKLYRDGNIKDAIKTLRTVVRKSKDDAIAWHYLGLALVSNEELKDARKAFQKAVEFRPNFAPSRTALARTLLYTRGVSEAEKQAKMALAIDPQSAEAQFVLGTIRLWQRSCSEALDHANATLIGQPNFAPAYLLRTQSLICDMAKASQRRWTPSAAPAEFSKEERILRLKKAALSFKEAAQSLEMFLTLAPTVTDAAMWKEQLETLRLFAEPADKPEAERTVFGGNEVTTKVRVLNKPEPSYTETARQVQVVGIVVLRAIFAGDGKVRNILVLSHLPYGLTEQAIEAARKIKFQPATKDGRPVSMFIQLEYYFNLY